MITPLIDGDIIAYWAAVCVDNIDGDPEDIPRVVDCNLREWVEGLDPDAFDDMVMCLSARSFRYQVAEDYKGNRDPSTKPQFLGVAYDYLRDQYGGHSKPNLEADDLLGIYATSGEYDSPVIVTIDKDLMQIPCRMWNPRRQEFHVTTVEDGHRRFVMQWLTGDSTDNYKGVPRVGEKRAEKALADAECLVTAARGVYEDKELEESYCLQQARLAYILQSHDWDPDTEAISLWHWDPDVKEQIHPV